MKVSTVVWARSGWPFLLSRPVLEVFLSKVEVLSYELPSNSLVSFKTTLDYFSGGYERSESSFLSGMSERHSSVHLGAGMSVAVPLRLKLNLRLNHDILGRSQGYEARIGLSRFFFFGPPLQVILGAGMNYYSEKILWTITTAWGRPK